MPFDQVLASVSVALLRVLVNVQMIAVSAGSIVSVLPASGVPLPVQRAPPCSWRRCRPRTISLMVPVSPANTVTEEPVVVLLPLDTDTPELALLVKPALVTVAVSPLMPFDQVLASVSVALLRVLVNVQVIAVSAGLIVSVLPASGCRCRCRRAPPCSRRRCRPRTTR